MPRAALFLTDNVSSYSSTLFFISTLPQQANSLLSCSWHCCTTVQHVIYEYCDALKYAAVGDMPQHCWWPGLLLLKMLVVLPCVLVRYPAVARVVLAVKASRTYSACRGLHTRGDCLFDSCICQVLQGITKHSVWPLNSASVPESSTYWRANSCPLGLLAHG
jgi:hypothetical protein